MHNPYLPGGNSPGKKWIFTYLLILGPIPLPTWNGAKEPNRKKCLILRSWIAGSGAALRKPLALRVLLLPRNITTVFACGQANIPHIPLRKADGRMGKATYCAS